jgi:hypothetical protein
MFTTEQKSQLAKLMATENLTIQHQKMQTAKFDPKNRILYLPIWQNMSGHLYDLLCGHEVGHALYTPADGWHDVATDKTKGSNYKSFLNVVEDARIEKKIKRRYPGLRTSFQKGYQDLTEKDFFGLKYRDVNDMSFIDRLNLYTKSQYTADSIEFTDFEKTLICKVENLETWDDVLRVTEEIYEYSKGEQQEIEQQDFEDHVYSSEYPEDQSESSADECEPDSDDGEESDESEEVNTPNSGNKSDNEDESGPDNLDTINHDKTSKETYEDQYTEFEPSCETDENYRQNESMLIDEKCKNNVYVNIPKPILKNIVTPAKRVHEILTKEYGQYMNGDNYINSFTEQDVSTWVNEFKSRNERYIGLLAKEFEMRKAAKTFSKSKLSDTGDIDINKLSTYKFDDNVFRKVMLTPKGKNHGLILLLDKSGSMTENMAGSIEQILILTMFCRKVNIPFIVYGFGDSVAVRCLDLGIESHEYTDEQRECFEQKENNIAFSPAFLREYLNSKMSNVEYTKAVRNLILIKKSYESRNHDYADRIPRPFSEQLSNTPLTQSLVAVAEIMKGFRKQNNLDITSLVVIHDGDADVCETSYVMKPFKNYNTDTIEDLLSVKHFDYYGSNVIISDQKNKLVYKLGFRGDNIHSVFLEWFRKVTSAKVFGFFLTKTNYQAKTAISKYYTNANGDSVHSIRCKNYAQSVDFEKKIMREFKSEKFIQSYLEGYNAFFIVAGGNELIVGNEEIVVDGNVTSNKLKTAFMKYNKKRAINRILVSRFITGIAA